MKKCKCQECQFLRKPNLLKKMIKQQTNSRLRTLIKNFRKNYENEFPNYKRLSTPWNFT